MFQSKKDYGDGAGIVYGLFLAPKIKYCVINNECGVLSQKTTLKRFNQNINDITFKEFLVLEQGKTLKNISKLNWKRELGDVRLLHRKVACEKKDESKNVLIVQ